MEKLEYKGIFELRKMLDDKEISSVEMTKYFLARIQKLDGELNSFITVCEDEALEEARQADEFMKLSGENPLLCGIPYAAKDMFCTKGVRTTAGSNILKNYIPPYDATVIAKMKSQKGVLLGKLNQDQFGHGASGENSAFGATCNPWDKTRLTGGSSSGSGAAVAAGMVPFALGTDTGGSIRNPAALCGVTGYKPTYGRVSRYGVIAMASSLDTIGHLGLSVKDIALIAGVTAGLDTKDSTSGIEATSYKLQAKSLHGVRIGVPKEYFIEGMDGEVEKRVREAILDMQKLGATIVGVSLPNTKYAQMVYAIVCPAEVSSNLAKYDGIRYGHVSSDANSLLEVYEKTRDEGFGDEAKRRILTGTYVLSSGYYDAYYKRAQKVRRLIIDEFAEVFKKVDILAAPSSPVLAALLGHASSNPLHGYIADQLNIPASLAGLPALSLPCGFGRPVDGGDVDLPVGLQLIGPQWGEQVLFDVGMAFQEATDWHKKFPKPS